MRKIELEREMIEGWTGQIEICKFLISLSMVRYNVCTGSILGNNDNDNENRYRNRSRRSMFEEEEKRMKIEDQNRGSLITSHSHHPYMHDASMS